MRAIETILEEGKASPKPKNVSVVNDVVYSTLKEWKSKGTGNRKLELYKRFNPVTDETEYAVALTTECDQLEFFFMDELSDATGLFHLMKKGS